MIETNEFCIRLMNRREMDIAVAWASAEGSNPGLYDAGCSHAIDPQGFFIAYRDDTPIGCIGAVAYNQNFGFVGFYCVHPDVRGTQVETALMQTALIYLGERTIGFTCSEDGVQRFTPFGFVSRHAIIRYHGTAHAYDVAPTISSLLGVPFRSIVELDQKLFFIPRIKFLSLWINQPKGVALGSYSDNLLTGYGVARICYHGYRIGPLGASTPQEAEQLFRALMTDMPHGAPVYIDVPERITMRLNWLNDMV